MFQPETEDMLPRAAPKPMALDCNDVTGKPSVPEVSILFNQLATSAASTGTSVSSQAKPKQSYALWKNNILPKVMCPPVASGITTTTTTSNNYHQAPMQNYMEIRPSIYPMRSPSAITGDGYANVSYEPQQYGRSIENTCAAPIYAGHQEQVVALNTHTNFGQLSHRPLQDTMKFPVQTPPPLLRSSHADVLTICAGTQTDAMTTTSPTSAASVQQLLNQMPSKQDYQQLVATLSEMRREQQRLTDICSLLLERNELQCLENKRTKLVVANVATQCDVYFEDEQYEAMPLLNYNVTAFENKQNVAQHSPRYQTTRGRSHDYCDDEQQSHPMTNGGVTMGNPLTEKTIVMKELARKYLPNDKFNKLLEDIRISSPSPQQGHQNKNNTPNTNDDDNDEVHDQYGRIHSNMTPLKNIENFERSPNDISNASYRYLKKYRLLPDEERLEEASPTIQSHGQKFNYRNEPSPLARQEGLLDLEAIRRQPKFT